MDTYCKSCKYFVNSDSGFDECRHPTNHCEGHNNVERWKDWFRRPDQLNKYNNCDLYEVCHPTLVQSIVSWLGL